MRAAITKLKQDEFYDVEIIDKKALGVVFKPVDNWAMVKDFTGYDPSVTGIYPGSVLVAVNDEDVMFQDFGTATSMIQAAFQDKDDAMKLTFRRSPNKEGYLNKRSAGRKGQPATWHQRYFKLENGVFTIAPSGKDGNTEPIEVPLKDATVSLVPYSEYMVDNCFRIQVGVISLVLQGADLADCIDWAALLTHAIAISNGGQHILEYEKMRSELEHNLQEALNIAPHEFLEDEEIAPLVQAIFEAVTAEDCGQLQDALDAAHLNQKLVSSGHLTEFLEAGAAIFNKLQEDAAYEEEDFKALQALVAPDEEQMQAILNAKAMDEAMADFGDEGDGDSDDERDTMTPMAPRETTVQALPESEIFGHTTEHMIYAEDEGDQVDEAELRQIKALNELSGPDPEEVGDPATEEDLSRVFDFFSKQDETTGERFISVMSFCTIYRMVSKEKGNLMAQMKIYNEFDSTKKGSLNEHDFVYGWLANAAQINSNRMLIKLKFLVEGDTMMI